MILERAELDALAETLRDIIWHKPEIRRRLQEMQINVVPSNFYSEIPSLAEVENAFEYSRGPKEEWFNQGHFDNIAIGQYLGMLQQYSQEFDPPLEADPSDPTCFYWKNPAFTFTDAMMYYCVLRHLKPEHVLEIGCGYSTLVADMALQRNGHGSMTLIEPYPKDFLRQLQSVRTLIEQPVQAIPIDELVGLAESADVLFIDSTHTVKVGSDCLTLYLRLFPRIRSHVHVHAHDIYLPYGLPKRYPHDAHVYWTEQFLLYAYLLDNPKTRVTYSSQYMFRTAPDVLDRFMHGRYGSGGASIWLELNGTTAMAGEVAI